MSKKNSTFGKLLALTTTVAAIGGACYIFRDQIKKSSLYKKASEKLESLRDKVSNPSTGEEDDFFFDDELEDDFDDDVFNEDAKQNRDYTSITINAKNEDDSIPTISVDGKPSDLKEETPSTDETASKEDITGYENEGLSDVDEDPDVLADMDKLDF